VYFKGEANRNEFHFFITGVKDTGDKFITCVSNAGDQFMTGVADTGDKSLDTNDSTNVYKKIQNGCNLTIRALGEADSLKNRETKISCQCTFKILVCPKRNLRILGSGLEDFSTRFGRILNRFGQPCPISQSK
jgi:hypothetical protein